MTMSDDLTTTVPAAEVKKELGNEAFGSKDYDGAAQLYGEAIKLDPKNHIYYSNRSACYVSLGQWVKASEDAKECLKLNPNFLKAYYRLALSLCEIGDLDAAHAAAKQGLSVDPDNPQLMKQLRIINGKKKDAAKKSSAEGGLPSMVASGVNSTDSEMIDLQQQFRASVRDYNICKSNIEKCQREQKINEITKDELDKLPLSESDAKMYRGIGKMFLLASRAEVDQYLDDEIDLVKKKEIEYQAKLEYLEKRLKSQRQNIEELSRSTPTISA